MGKRSHGDAKPTKKKSNGATHAKGSILADEKAVDPTLALLFASSVCFSYVDLFSYKTLMYTFRQVRFKHPQKLVMRSRLRLKIQNPREHIKLHRSTRRLNLRPMTMI